MTEQSVTVVTSLDARTAALFVQTASKFGSNIKVSIDSKTANAKSIMGIISLEIIDGRVVNIAADGEDEVQAVDELAKFLG